MTKPKLLFSLNLITWVNIIAMAALPIAAALEGKDMGMAFFPIMMLGCTLSILHPIIKSLHKRIEFLEEKLNDIESAEEKS
jgi:hypothetical protein